MGDIGKERRFARRQMTRGANMFRGICEVMREIYDLVYTIEDNTLRNNLTETLLDAFIMAKKMDKRLGYYKTTYNDTTGRGGTGLERIQKVRDRVSFRNGRAPR